MLLLSIDPAAERSVSSTGWALGQFSKTAPYTLIGSGTIEGGFEGFRTNTLPWDTDIVVVEHYVVFNRAADPTPLLIEGVVRYLRPDTILQPASGKNALVTDANLKACGLWSTTGHHHDEREAVRHALVYLIRNKHIPTITFVKGGPT